MRAPSLTGRSTRRKQLLSLQRRDGITNLRCGAQAHDGFETGVVSNSWDREPGRIVAWSASRQSLCVNLASVRSPHGTDG